VNIFHGFSHLEYFLKSDEAETEKKKGNCAAKGS